MTNLYPPVLDSKAYSIPYIPKVGEGTATSNFYDIIFALPSMVDPDLIKHIQVVIKYQSTNEPAVNRRLSPDKATLFINGELSITNFYWEKYDDQGNYRLRIPYWAFADGKPQAGTAYTVQVRFGANMLWGNAGDGLSGTGFSNFAAWRQNAVTQVPSMFGEWSNTQTVFCYDSYVANFDYNFNDFVPEIVWYYSPRSDDPIQQVSVTYVYQDFQGTQYGNQVFNGQYNNDATFTLRTQIPIAPFFSISGTIEAITKNNTLITTGFIINPIKADTEAISVDYGVVYPVLDGHVAIKELEGEEVNDGIIAVEMSIDNNPTEGTTFNLYRVNLLDFNTIRVAEGLTVNRAQKQVVKDFTVEMGEDYEYIGCAMDSQGNMSAFLMSPFPYGYKNKGYGRLMFMGAAYLTTCKHQLRLQGNVSISAFKRNTQDQFQSTLGSKYPFYSRVAQNNYRTMQVSALISINFDPTSAFLRLDPNNGLYWDEKAALAEDSVYNSTRKQYQDSADQCTTRYMEIANEMDEYKIGIDEDRYKDDYDYKLEVDGVLAEYQNQLNVLSQQITEYSAAAKRGPSYLKIQDRDLYSQSQFSLTRRRRQYANKKENEYIEQVYDKETELDDDERKKLTDKMGPMTIYSSRLFKNSALQYGTQASDQLVFVERKFRDLVMSWLSDGKPKLFRSETEGNMIVMVSAPSFTPFDKTSRMVYSMSCTLTEIADYNLENLKAYDLIPSEIESVYIPGNEYDFEPGDLDPNVEQGLIYQYSESFDIPNTPVGQPIDEIDTYSAVKNGFPPYTFAKVALPAGIDIDPDTGIISGTPTTARSKGTGIVSVIDKYTTTPVEMEFNIGEIYPQLVFAEIKEAIPPALVGDQITSFSVKDLVSGGVPEYQFFATNLPLGISIDRLTGTISGSFAADVEEGEAIITVMDSLGNRADQILHFGKSTMPLTFQYSSEYNFQYLEVGVPIDELDVSGSVYGGTKNPNESLPGYKFSISGQPDGITIDPDTGVISGTPTTARSSGTMTVTATDYGNPESSASISITYLRVLDTFTFTYSQSFDILRQNGEMVDIPVGTIIKEIDVMAGSVPAVTGGLQYSTGNPYRFTAIGLSPNFEINNAGKINGQAIVAQEARTATLIAIDARGKEVSIKISISTITGALYVRQDKNNYVLPEAIVNKGSVDGSEYAFYIPATEITGGKTPYTLTLDSGFPSGVSITPQYEGDVIKSYRVGGTPTSTIEGGVGKILIQDDNGSKFSLEVTVGGVYETLAWNPVNDLNIPAKNIGDNYVGPSFDGVTGGKKPYNFSAPDLPKFGYSIYNPQNVQNSIDSHISGTVTAAYAEEIVGLTVTDALGQTATVYITVGKTQQGLSLTAINSMTQYEFVKNLTEIPDKELQILEASGGVAPYTYRLKNNQQTFAGGFKLSSEGYIYGMPNTTQSSTDLSVLFEVVDAEGNTASCSNSWYCAVVREQFSKLKSDPYDEGWLRKNINVSASDIYGKQFGPYFNDGNNNGVQTSSENLPSGISMSNQYKLVGIPQQATNSQITSKVKITRPASQWTPEMTCELTLIFTGVSGDLYYSISPPGLSLPAMAIGQPITDLVISNGLSGGQQPYTWTLTGLPKGLTYDYPGTGEVCTIKGTPTEACDSGTIVILVTDNAGAQVTGEIDQGGVYEPIVFAPITSSIPEIESGTEITPIDVSGFVSGGQKPYKFYSNDLSKWGYRIGEENGIITGTDLSEVAVAAGEATITVKDANQLEATQKIKVGGLKGPVSFTSSAEIAVQAGKVNTTINQVDVSKGVAGGQTPYSYAFSELQIPSAWSGLITINSSTGIITGKRPAAPTAATTIKVIISDATGDNDQADIPLGEVTA